MSIHSLHPHTILKLAMNELLPTNFDELQNLLTGCKWKNRLEMKLMFIKSSNTYYAGKKSNLMPVITENIDQNMPLDCTVYWMSILLFWLWCVKSSAGIFEDTAPSDEKSLNAVYNFMTAKFGLYENKTDSLLCVHMHLTSTNVRLNIQF